MSQPTANNIELLITNQASSFSHFKYGKLLNSIYEIWLSRELLRTLVMRDITARYRQATLGILWVVLTPLLFMIVLTVVFGVRGRMGPDHMPYPVFFLPAFLVWSYFSSVINRGSNALKRNASLLSKVYIPRLLLPLSSALSPLLDLLIGLVVACGILLYFQYIPPWQILFLPLFLLLAMFCGLGISILIGALNAHYRDVHHVLPVLMRLWFFSTPIIYSLDRIPEQYRIYFAINPFTAVITGVRWSLIGLPPPSMAMLSFSIAFTLFVLVIGLIVFQQLEKTVTDVL